MQNILVELAGIEPATSWMPFTRAPNCATAPRFYLILSLLSITYKISLTIYYFWVSLKWPLYINNPYRNQICRSLETSIPPHTKTLNLSMQSNLNNQHNRNSSHKRREDYIDWRVLLEDCSKGGSSQLSGRIPWLCSLSTNLKRLLSRYFFATIWSP